MLAAFAGYRPKIIPTAIKKPKDNAAARTEEFKIISFTYLGHHTSKNINNGGSIINNYAEMVYEVWTKCVILV